MRTCILAALATLLPVVASAQVVPDTGRLSPTQGVEVKWPAPTVNPEGLNAPEGFRIKAVSPTQTGVVIRTWDAALSLRALTLTPAMLPEGAFTLTVHPFNVRGEAGASNVAGPFGKIQLPAALTGVTAGVVGVPQ